MPKHVVRAKKLLHLDSPHVLATSTSVDPDDAHQFATTLDLVFVNGKLGFGLFVIFVFSVKWTQLNCEKNTAT
jgi:hypothetical protein